MFNLCDSRTTDPHRLVAPGRILRLLPRQTGRQRPRCPPMPFSKATRTPQPRSCFQTLAVRDGSQPPVMVDSFRREWAGARSLDRSVQRPKPCFSSPRARSASCRPQGPAEASADIPTAIGSKPDGSRRAWSGVAPTHEGALASRRDKTRSIGCFMTSNLEAQRREPGTDGVPSLDRLVLLNLWVPRKEPSRKPVVARCFGRDEGLEAFDRMNRMDRMHAGALPARNHPENPVHPVKNWR